MPATSDCCHVVIQCSLEPGNAVERSEAGPSMEWPDLWWQFLSKLRGVYKTLNVDSSAAKADISLSCARGLFNVCLWYRREGYKEFLVPLISVQFLEQSSNQIRNACTDHVAVQIKKELQKRFFENVVKVCILSSIYFLWCGPRNVQYIDGCKER